MSAASAVEAPGAAKNPVVKKLALGLLLPLFFAVVFPLAFVSASHNSAPNGMPLVIVGPAAVVSDIASSLAEDGKFEVRHTDVTSEAESSVRERHADGALLIEVTPPADATSSPTFEVTTYVAGGGGLAVVDVVTKAGESVAQQLGTTATVVDVAPLAESDSLGTSLFFLLIYTTLGAYLVIITLMQVMPKARLVTRYLAVGIAAIAAPLAVFGLSSIFVGDYGASPETLAILFAFNALYVLTIGAAAILVEQLMGEMVTFGVMAFLVLLNFPGAGGAIPASLLPDFWQWVHSFYFGSAALESFRSVVYFSDASIIPWTVQLGVWAIVLVLLTLVIELTKRVRRQRALLLTMTPVLSAPTGAAQTYEGAVRA